MSDIVDRKAGRTLQPLSFELSFRQFQTMAPSLRDALSDRLRDDLRVSK
jgi:hypothetical protein